MHRLIEEYFLSIEKDSSVENKIINDIILDIEQNDDEKIFKEINFFKKFLKEFKYKKLYPEQKIYDIELKISGTIDLLVENIDGSFSIFDWKRTKGIKFRNSTKMKQPLNELYDANYYKYSLQLNTYKYILEKKYNIKVKDMYLIVLYNENDNFLTDEVFVIQDKIKLILPY